MNDEERRKEKSAKLVVLSGFKRDAGAAHARARALPPPHRRDAHGAGEPVVLQVERRDVAHGVGDEERIDDAAGSVAAAKSRESAPIEVHVRQPRHGARDALGVRLGEEVFGEIASRDEREGELLVPLIELGVRDQRGDFLAFKLGKLLFGQLRTRLVLSLASSASLVLEPLSIVRLLDGDA